MSTADVRVHDGVACVVLEPPGVLGWWLDDRFAEALELLVAGVRAVAPGSRGVLVRLPRREQWAGRDAQRAVDLLGRLGHDLGLRRTLFERVLRPARALTELTGLGLPIVTTAEGDLLGPSLSVWLAGGRRCVVAAPGARVALPELGLGLLPMPGTIARVVGLMGLLPALGSRLLGGQPIAPANLVEAGLADEVLQDPVDLDDRMHRWLEGPPPDDQATTADTDPFAGGLSSPVSTLTSRLRARRRGAPERVPLDVLALAVEGARVDGRTATTIEARGFVRTARDEQAANLIGTRLIDRAADVGVDQRLRVQIRAAMADEASALAACGVAPSTIRRAALQAGIAGAAVDSWQLGTSSRDREPSDVGPGASTHVRAHPELAVVAERVLLAAALAALSGPEGSDVPARAALGRASVAAGFPESFGGAHRFLLAYPGGRAAATNRLHALRDDRSPGSRT